MIQSTSRRSPQTYRSRKMRGIGRHQPSNEARVSRSVLGHDYLVLFARLSLGERTKRESGTDALTRIMGKRFSRGVVLSTGPTVASIIIYSSTEYSIIAYDTGIHSTATYFSREDTLMGVKTSSSDVLLRITSELASGVERKHAAAR
jgi:hypothetical protein